MDVDAYIGVVTDMANVKLDELRREVAEHAMSRAARRPRLSCSMRARAWIGRVRPSTRPVGPAALRPAGSSAGAEAFESV